MDKNKQGKSKILTAEYLDLLIEEAIVDCYDDEECLTGFWNMLEENLVFPFPANAIGEEIIVTGMTEEDGQIKVICEKKGKKYSVNILDIEFSDSLNGREWIEAYRRWNKGRW